MSDTTIQVLGNLRLTEASAVLNIEKVLIKKYYLHILMQNIVRLYILNNFIL